MVFGMSLAAYTAVHVAISLIGIGSVQVVLFGLLKGLRFNGWTGLFLATTVATSVTGFGFPVAHFMASHGHVPPPAGSWAPSTGSMKLATAWRKKSPDT